MKHIFVICSFFIITFCNSQNITFPNANFKARLLQSSPTFQMAKNNLGEYIKIDDNDDGEIQVSEALNVYELSISGRDIYNLIGIESFSNLTYLFCNQNQITQLDVSDLINLQFLYCDQNQLNELNVTGLINLKILSCYQNQLTQLDVSGLNNLTKLFCFQNQLTQLNVSSLSNLTELACSFNQLTQLDVSSLNNLTALACRLNLLTQLDVTGLPNLTTLYCQHNQLTQLNVTGLANLTALSCDGNQLTQLDVTDLFNLTSITCDTNQLTQLDVTSLINLTFLSCDGNQLTHLYLKNGKVITLYFNNNPNITYICADEIQFSAILSLLNSYNYGNVEVNSYCSYTLGGEYNTITGNFIYDLDNNGCDADDQSYILNQKISINDQTSTGADFTNVQGQYKFYTHAGTFSITPIFENSSCFSSSPVDTTIIFNDNNNNIVNKNFCITPVGIHPDLEVIISPTNVARPGFNSDYQLTYKNKGNQTLSGNVNLVFNDDVLDLISTSVNPTNTSIGNLNWDYTSLLPFETKTIYLVFNTNGPMETPPTNIGDTLNFVASITPDSGDETPLDNVFNLNQIIVGAYDPNIITCLQGEIVHPSEIGKYLHYVIDFENTGNFPAENVVVVANIDPLKYNINSLQVLNSSHTIKTKVTGNKIEYIFENINLEALAHGNFLIKIKSVNTLSIGDAVSQLADIYFDYNFPIQTNNAETVYNYLESGIDENDLDVSITVSPNPSNGNYIVTAENQIKSIEIYDVNGRVILTKIVNDTAVKLDISDRNKGVYYVKSISEKGASILKIVKE